MRNVVQEALECGICHEEDVDEVGELDSCAHFFCFECIWRWSSIESRCPFCKARFTRLEKKKQGVVLEVRVFVRGASAVQTTPQGHAWQDLQLKRVQLGAMGI
jgi:Ring finger domain